jgi:RHS repeat-associated protein
LRRIGDSKMGKKRTNRVMNMQRKPAPSSQQSIQAQASGESPNTTYYVHGPKGIHAQKKNGQWQWMAQDGLGSVRSVVNNNATVDQAIDYDPFGNPIEVFGPEQTMYGYTGEPTDENDLVYLRNRYYNPQLGTFMSQDSVEGSANDPLSLNRYAYVQGNPVNRTDPSGMMPNPSPSNAFAGRAGLMPMVATSPIVGIPDPMAMLNWVNNINNGCYLQQSFTPTPGANVHVPCGAGPVNARSHPSFYGNTIGSYPPGTFFTLCEERDDNPSSASGLEPAKWVRVAPNGNGCADSQIWIRRTDGARQLLQDGLPQDCTAQPPILTPPSATQPGSFEYISPGCTRGGTCVTGTQTPEYQVGFVLACEAGAIGYTDFEQMRQAMVDIAHVIRSRMRAGGFPNTALDVIRQSRAFQCYSEGSSANLAIPLGQSSRIAEALVYDEPLPPPSFPQVEYALFFFGLPWQGQASTSANSIPRPDVLDYFTNAKGQTAQAIVNAPYNILDGIYLGNGPMNASGFGTFFFSDDPLFTGFIP